MKKPGKKTEWPQCLARAFCGDHDVYCYRPKGHKGRHRSEAQEWVRVSWAHGDADAHTDKPPREP